MQTERLLVIWNQFRNKFVISHEETGLSPPVDFLGISSGLVLFCSYFCPKHRLWYSLEPPHRGGSNEYPQSMFEQK